MSTTVSVLCLPERRTRALTSGESTLESASMDLRKWHSNLASLNYEATHVSKVLGITWDSRSDELSFPVKTIVSLRLTKRELLQVVASFFNPLALMSAFVLRGKIILQDLWKQYDWDQEVDRCFSKQIAEWTEEFAQFFFFWFAFLISLVFPILTMMSLYIYLRMPRREGMAVASTP